MTAIGVVTSDDVLDRAYAWLYRRCREVPFWHLWWQWDDLRWSVEVALITRIASTGTTPNHAVQRTHYVCR